MCNRGQCDLLSLADIRARGQISRLRWVYFLRIPFHSRKIVQDFGNRVFILKLHVIVYEITWKSTLYLTDDDFIYILMLSWLGLA